MASFHYQQFRVAFPAAVPIGLISAVLLRMQLKRLGSCVTVPFHSLGCPARAVCQVIICPTLPILANSVNVMGEQIHVPMAVVNV